MQAGRALAGREQPGNGRRLGLGVDADAAHHVVTGRADLHRLFSDVDVGQLKELVVHRWQSALDVVGTAAAGDVEVYASVRATATLFDLAVDRARDLVTREKIGSAARVLFVRVPAVGFFFGVGRLGTEHLGDVPEHETLAA